MFKCLVGVDEAGRGPLAGPVAVGIAVVPHDFDWALIPGVGDSKKVTEKNREAVFLRAEALKKEKVLNYTISLVSARTIDRIGISRAVLYGIKQGFTQLALDPSAVSVKLDGLLKAPAEYEDQETIIQGDAKERIIGLASILAKVTRDRVMVLRGHEYPEYGFEVHKGYGTKAHGVALSTHGLSPIHRASFCKRYLP